MDERIRKDADALAALANEKGDDVSVMGADEVESMLEWINEIYSMTRSVPYTDDAARILGLIA